MIRPAVAAARISGPMLDDRSWFDRGALEVARDLLGKRLVVDGPQGRVSGRLVETEAYLGPEDLAAHSARGLTARNAVMFGPPGYLYVYLVYGIHHCLNVVCGPGSKPEAVLLRAAQIEEGEALARARRGLVAETRLAAGPGNLAAAFGLDRTANGTDLLSGSIRIADGPAPERVVSARRVGVEYAGEWATRAYRFMIAGDPHISRR